RERLFGPDVFARVDRARGHLDVGRGDGQVHDDVDVGVVQCRVHPAPLGDTVFLGARLGGVLEKVGDDVDLEVREDRQVVQVLLADVAGADDGDAHGATSLGGAHAFTPWAPAEPLCRYARLWAMPSKM